MLKTLSLLTLLCINLPLFASIKELPVPGGIKKIALTAKSAPLVQYKGKRVAVIKDKNQFTAIIGIPLDTPVQTQYIKQLSPNYQSKSFELKNKSYKVQRLVIKNTRKVTPLKVDEIRIKTEQEDFDKTLTHWINDSSSFKQNFIAPVRGYITSTYGLKRIYNGIPKSPHTALDIAASTGTPIKATAGGKVINIHNRFYTGNTVIIDHGQGLMSLYAHLNQFKVKNGQYVKQGETIGTVGMTGRVTGPHLHWALYLNQTSVDPLLFISKKQILPLRKKG